MTLEKILQTHFGVSEAYKAKQHDTATPHRHMTEAGEAGLHKLVELMHELDELLEGDMGLQSLIEELAETTGNEILEDMAEAGKSGAFDYNPDNARRVDVDYILVQYYNNKTNFMHTPRNTGKKEANGRPIYTPLTISGEKAYNQLLALVSDLGELFDGRFDSVDTAMVLDALVRDEI